MKGAKHRILLTLFLSCSILYSQIFSTTVEASSRTFHQEVTQDAYQKAITKGFLGRSYGVGGNRYICNTYVESALEKISVDLNESNPGFKDVRITKGKKATPTSYDWTSFRVRFTYTASIYNEESGCFDWDDKKTVSILSRKNKGTRLRCLEIGDVLTYGSGGGHIALYFGKYNNKEKVLERLVELGVYKPSELRRKKDRYNNKKGKPIIREYEGGGVHWRVHATNKGLLIDNAIVSKRSNGTSSFGKWRKTIPSGYTISEEIVK